MSFQDRDYQTGAVDAFFRYLYEQPTGNPVIAMPTGTGKSVVIARICQRAYTAYPGVRIMILTHVKELIEQNHAKLVQLWPGAPAGVYSAGLKKRDVDSAITFAGVLSVAKRPEHFGHIDIILIDEAHTVSPSETAMYQKFIDAVRKRNPYVRIGALTATPWRLGHGHIAGEGSIFNDVCFDLTTMECFNWLLDEGYLCPLVPRPTDVKLDTDGVHMRGGEFIAGELAAHVNQDPKTRAAVAEAIQLAGERYSWLVFCAGAEHAQRTAGILREQGIGAEAVYDSMSADAAAIRERWPGMLKGDRDEVIDWWKRGLIRALTNNNILTTGIDHPALDCIIMLRPTASTVLWVQMLGRGTRPYYAPGFDLSTRDGRLQAIATSHKPNCLVLDFARNTVRLGPINDPVIPRRKGEKVGEAPIKICPSCGTYNHASARHCFLCFAEFPFNLGPKIADTAGTEELIKKSEPVSYDIRVLEVEHVTYAMHTKLGRPPSVKVSYYCGLRRFQEYIGFEHEDSFSKRRARDWWQARRPGPNDNMPATTASALALTDHLKVPTHLRVWLNKKPHPDILAACFDGTAFGEHEDSGSRPAAETQQPVGLGVPLSKVPAGMEDDIPF